MYKILFSKSAQKDAAKIKKSNLDGFYSRRINIKHRLIYAVDEENEIIKILRMWSHYE